MDNFRVGDMVVITGWVHDRSEHHNFPPEMDVYIGQVGRIRRRSGDVIRIDIDGGCYSWHPTWLSHPKGRVDIYEC
jgi:hypothetical protein